MTDANNPTTPSLDMDAVAAMQRRIWAYRQGQQVQLMMHIGKRLELWEALRGAGPVSAAQLADATDLSERWLLEWLRCMAAADIIASSDGEVFHLSDEAAAVMAPSSMLTYAGSAMERPRSPETVDHILESFRRGVGMSYDDHGAHEAAHVEAAFGNWIAHILVPQFVPKVEGLTAKLEAGARVADVGCGAGSALRLLAEAFPNGSYHGYDLSEHAIELARKRATESGSDVSFFEAGSDAMEGEYDVVLTFDCLHDMTHPDRAVADIRSHIADDGVLLVKEIRSAATFEENRANPMLAMMYATSIQVCMSSALSEPDGLGLGTLGLHPARLTELMRDGGFSTVETHAFDDPFNLYYEVRP